MQNPEKVAIWPILCLEADWPSNRYDFDLGVHLIRAEREVLDAISESGLHQNPRAITDLCLETKWLIALPTPKPTEHVSLNQIGISFEEELESAIVNAFLTSLRLTRQTSATCPIRFEANLVGDSVQPDSVEIDENDCYYMVTDYPPIHLPESFEVGDLQLPADLWTCITRLRKLDFWANRV
jgi:hypothetical protein